MVSFRDGMGRLGRANANLLGWLMASETCTVSGRMRIGDYPVRAAQLECHPLKLTGTNEAGEQMEHPETHFVTPTHGPRPNGKPTECFYCRVAVGGVHATECPIRVRTVVMRYTFEVVIPYSQEADTGLIEFSRNESSWCAGNALDELQRRKEDQCWCSDFTAEFVREATAEDEAKFDLNIVDR